MENQNPGLYLYKFIICKKKKIYKCLYTIFRFGFAITNLGDLNKDGFDDIAIGAPYEGNGVIYVYQGSAFGIVIEPSQVSLQFYIESLKDIINLTNNYT